ncbi:MAG: 4-hydroxy-tetrahydrodipicolinate reductase [Candidatus Krumholzibacteria bacterium]|nr:4-hydroxy-tetrahydrodipicolinate reductase [Candidatus Krumholzibacteria bacterium]
MLRVIVNGALGRMGGEAARAIAESGDLELSGAVDAPGRPGIGSEIFGVTVTGDLAAALEGAAAAVDFTNPDAAVAFIETCAAAGVPAITGTTGLQQVHLAAAAAAAMKIPVIASPNMSAGVNLLFSVTGAVAKALHDFDVEIVEIHHNRKKDSPSGTAARLARVVSEARGGMRIVHGREGMIGERAENEIGMHSLRGGDVTGEHTVIFAGEGERIELTHRAHSRRTFAMGTLRAIRFIAGAPAGLYTMSDVLGL